MTALSKSQAASFDVETVRRDFPSLAGTMHGKPLAYLDSAASALKPQVVLDKLNWAHGAAYATVHRGIYQLSQNMTEAYEQARETTARFIGARGPEEIVFVRGATEAINLVAQSWGRAHLKAGDEIILSEMEHHSNIVPWQLLRDQIGIVIKVAPITDDGALDYQAYEALLGPKTRLVAITHMSNVLGTEVDIRRVVTAAKTVGARVLIDGCQAAPHMPLDMQTLGCDFYAFSGHKLYAPTGIGVLWGRDEVLAAMPPYHGGGSMIEEVTFARTTFLPPPLRFEAGTPNFVGAVALAAAMDYVDGLGLDAIHGHEMALLDYAEQGLRTVPKLRIHGTARPKGSIISFTMAGVHPHDIGTILDRDGIAIRAGHHCAQPLMERLGVPATARASLGLYSNRSDIDRLIAGLEKVVDIFG